MAPSVLSGPVPLGGLCLHLASHSLPQFTGISLGNLGFALAVLVFLAVMVATGCSWADSLDIQKISLILYPPLCVDACVDGAFWEECLGMRAEQPWAALVPPTPPGEQ